MTFFKANSLLQSNSHFVEVVLTPEEGTPFSLSNFRQHLGDHGIEDVNWLEVYNSREEAWVQLPWNHHGAAIQVPGLIFLIRIMGVTELHGLEDVLSFASQFPDLKGKARVV